MIFYIFLIYIILMIKFWDVAYKKYQNEYPIRYYIGLRGKGKTTLATKTAIKHQKLGHHCYSNFELFGSEKLDPDDFGKYNFPVNSAIFLDEVSLIWSNRDFKSFKKHVEEFLRLSRKRKIYIYLYSQSFDVDKKIRDIVDVIFIIDKYFGVISVAKKLNRYIVLHKASKDEAGAQNGENFISEDFKFSFPTQWEFTFIPRWVKFFNSFEAPYLPTYKTERYLFNNESKLYKVKYYKGYKIDQINDLKNNAQKLWLSYKYSFYLKFEDFLEVYI